MLLREFFTRQPVSLLDLDTEKARAQASIAREDVVDGVFLTICLKLMRANGFPDDSEGEPGSGSGSEED